MSPSELVKKLLWEPVEKQPGWVYLAVAVYFGVEAVSLGGHYLSDELWVAVLTPTFYWIGHLIDAALFKKSDGNERFALAGLDEARKEARDSLRVQAGVYDVLMKLLAAAGTTRQKARVHFQNEFAKFARSAAAPLLLLAAWLALTRDWRFALLSLLSPVLIIVGVRLKLRHMRTLYRLAASLQRPPRFAVHDLEARGATPPVRLFFWDGGLIASASLVLDAERRTGTAVLVEGAADRPGAGPA